MRTFASSEEVFNYAKTNNWLLLDSSEGYVVSQFLTPSGNIVEMYFEKNKITVRALTTYTYKL